MFAIVTCLYSSNYIFNNYVYFIKKKKTYVIFVSERIYSFFFFFRRAIHTAGGFLFSRVLKSGRDDVGGENVLLKIGCETLHSWLDLLDLRTIR